MKNFLRAAMAALFGALSPVAAAHAFEIRPTVADIRLPADSSGVTLSIANTREALLPVTFRIVERRVAENGDEERLPADNQFVLFPPQMSVPAGQSRAIRLQYVGAAPTQSRSFTLYAEEPAVGFPEGETGIRTRLIIGASIHVFANTARAAPRIAAATDTPEGVRVTLENTGDRYAYIDELILRFADTEFSGVELGAIAGRTLLPPGGRRSFVVPGVRGAPELSTPP